MNKWWHKSNLVILHNHNINVILHPTFEIKIKNTVYCSDTPIFLYSYKNEMLTLSCENENKYLLILVHCRLAQMLQNINFSFLLFSHK